MGRLSDWIAFPNVGGLRSNPLERYVEKEAGGVEDINAQPLPSNVLVSCQCLALAKRNYEPEGKDQLPLTESYPLASWGRKQGGGGRG